MPARIEELRERMEELVLRRRTAQRRKKEEAGALELARKELQAAEKAQTILQNIAKEVQEKAHRDLSRIVTHCLQSAFPSDPFEFRIVFERKRGKTEARIVLILDDMELDPLEGAGGGQADVVGLALRLSCLMMHQPALRPLLIFDEPFRFISPENQPMIPQMIEALADLTGTQFVIVTNIPAIQTGKVVRIK